MSELNQEDVNEQMYLFVKQWLDDLPFEEYKKVPVMAIGYCMARLSKQDALLKEQDPVEPRCTVNNNGFHYDYCCACNTLLPVLDDSKKASFKANFCPSCGKPVKWNG